MQTVHYCDECETRIVTRCHAHPGASVTSYLAPSDDDVARTNYLLQLGIQAFWSGKSVAAYLEANPTTTTYGDRQVIQSGWAQARESWAVANYGYIYN